MGSRPFSTIDLNYICCALRTWTYPLFTEKIRVRVRNHMKPKKATSIKALGTCS